VRNEAEVQRQHEVAGEASAIWNSLREVTDGHPYLLRKKLPAAGLRISDVFRFSDAGYFQNALVIAVLDPPGAIANLQGIDANGMKRFLSGGRVKGCYAVIEQPGAPPMDESCFVCEGWASGRAFALMKTVSGYAALSAKNLPAVAGMVRQRHPASTIYIAADRDDAGREAAHAASMAAQAHVWTPDDVNDFSDLWIQQGEAA
jgi:putative DNA primase/helicase